MPSALSLRITLAQEQAATIQYSKDTCSLPLALRAAHNNIIQSTSRLAIPIRYMCSTAVQPFTRLCCAEALRPEAFPGPSHSSEQRPSAALLQCILSHARKHSGHERTGAPVFNSLQLDHCSIPVEPPPGGHPNPSSTDASRCFYRRVGLGSCSASRQAALVDSFSRGRVHLQCSHQAALGRRATDPGREQDHVLQHDRGRCGCWHCVICATHLCTMKHV